jgi:hypothetical protein
MALDMRRLEFFCTEEDDGDRVAMVFKKRRAGLLHWVYVYECPSCGNIGHAFLRAGRLKLTTHLDRATRRNQRKRTRASR